MIFPNKFISFDNSVLSKISYLVEENISEISLYELFKNRISKFNDVSEFIIALDVLYTLGVIDFDNNTRIVKYVD